MLIKSPLKQLENRSKELSSCLSAVHTKLLDKLAEVRETPHDEADLALLLTAIDKLQAALDNLPPVKEMSVSDLKVYLNEEVLPGIHGMHMILYPEHPENLEIDDDE